MARKRRKDQKWQEIHREDLDSDAVSLGDLFKDLASQHPDLTLEETSRRDADSRPADAFADGRKQRNKGSLEAKSLRECPIVPLQKALSKKGQNAITLWYGTTEDQARKIAEEGFKRAEVRFTKKLSEARGSAIRKAKQRDDTPVVISCEIDLGKYRSFGKSGNTYTFYIPTGKGAVDGAVIGKEVVKDVSIVEDGAPKHSKEKTESQETIDVVVTRTSGKLGVLWWINRYLELEGEVVVDENHPAVEAILRWVDAQYAEGRDDPVSDEEMRMQVRQHLKQEGQTDWNTRECGDGSADNTGAS